VLDAGRRLASALSRETIFVALRDAALQLLRGERCLVLKVEGEPEKEEISAVSGEIDAGFSRTMVRRALTSGQAIAFVEGAPSSLAGASETVPVSESVLLSGVRSALCAPVLVRGRAVACFYVTHRHVAALFGDDEKRLADFIATIAGAALENAEGFAELHHLNHTLEVRILESKQAQERIQEQAALLDKARDAIAVLDLDDQIVYWNQSAERLYGWPAAAALGQKTGALFQQPSPQLAEAARAALETGEWTGELHQVTRAGKPIIVESRWSLVRDDAGRPRARLIVNTDITQKKELETQFLRAQRMESIGTLAGGIAHDMNNILTPILMAVDLLKLSLPESQRHVILADMQSCIQRGADMVKLILSFARGVAGQRVALQLKHVIRDIDKMLQHTLPKSITIRTNVPRDLWVISGDATQLHQMLMNLCVNARDAMPEGGQLAITAANTVVESARPPLHPDARPGPYVLLSVEDTGTGIPADVLDKIFDPFFTTKEYGKGTGLGLATVQGIVKGHGGFINVHSTVGKGTRLLVYLPAVDAAPLALGQIGHASPTRGHGELILVVDDEAPIRKLLQQNLEAHGYRVLTARDGNEAIAVYSQHAQEIALVVTDMMMPGLDGRATITALAMINPQVRIVAVSGLTTCLDVELESVVKARLGKPFSIDKLLETVDQTVGMRRAEVGGTRRERALTAEVSPTA
jgi:PAS domain S-box-containing protein